MDNEIKQNFEERIRLLTKELLASLDSDFEAMLRKHSADGLLRSGNTIISTMDLISSLVVKLYSEILNYIDVLKLEYYSSIEDDIMCLAVNANERLKPDILLKFQRSTEIAGNPSLYDRLLPDVEADLANSHSVFQNKLNAKIINLKKNTSKSPLEKILWVIEIFVVSASIFISGMWFNDPQGNYEPVLVGLGFVIPLIYLGIKRASKP